MPLSVTLQGISDHRKGVFYTIAAALLLSSAGLFIKALSLGPFQINFYRSLIAAPTILLVQWHRRQPLNLDLTAQTLACGLCYAGVMILFVAATKFTTAANAVFLQYTSPVFLLVLEPLWFRLPFARRDLVTVVACLAGMVLFFTGRMERGGALGNGLAVASGLSLALFSLLLKIIQRRHPEQETFGIVVLGNALVVLICLPFALPHLALTPHQLLAMVYLGVFQLGLSWMLFAAGMRFLSATAAVITCMLETVFNPLWVFLGMGERPSGFAMLGGMVMIGALVWYHAGRAAR
ncbi:MAG: DMT family transporter [Holophaga sp.]|nr:DMT family transporter [Holophaga sp.]